MCWDCSSGQSPVPGSPRALFRLLCTILAYRCRPHQVSPVTTGLSGLPQVHLCSLGRSGTGLSGSLRIQCQPQDTKTSFNLFKSYNCKNGFQEGARQGSAAVTLSLAF